MTILTLKTQPRASLEAEIIAPDNILGKTEPEIASLKAMHGNEPVVLGDFFAVKAGGSDLLILNGDLCRVKNIAAGMTRGRVEINGHAGMHLGARMQGGEIHVSGNTGDWAGAEMTGGKICICGNAGHGLGGAYRGSRWGMNRGLIIVEGNAGNEAGAGMRRGLIVVKGNTGDFAGAFMIAGTIVVFGKLGSRAGAGLVRGTIITFQPAELLPTFRYDCRYRPEFLSVIWRDLRASGVSIGEDAGTGCFERYSGDFNRLGKGEILIHDQRE